MQIPQRIRRVEPSSIELLEKRVERMERMIAVLVDISARKHFGREILQFALDHASEDEDVDLRRDGE